MKTCAIILTTLTLLLAGCTSKDKELIADLEESVDHVADGEYGDAAKDAIDGFIEYDEVSDLRNTSGIIIGKIYHDEQDVKTEA